MNTLVDILTFIHKFRTAVSDRYLGAWLIIYLKVPVGEAGSVVVTYEQPLLGALTVIA